MTIAFSVRNPSVSKARGRNRQKVRVLLLESLEAKQLYAVDLFEFGSTAPAIVDANQVSTPSVLANLTQSVQDPVAAARVAPATYQSFGSQSLLAKDPDALDASQAQKVDQVAGLSKQTFEPSAYLSQFKQRVPSKSEAQAGLIGGTIVPQASDPNSRGIVTTAISAETPQAMQFVDGSALASLFRSFNVSSNSAKTQSDSGNSSRSIQWVGGFCREDGIEIFSDASRTQDSQALVGEGEGDDPLVPTFELPSLASSLYASNLSLFVPPSQSTSSAITTLGAFTPSSLSSPDYMLPGLNWVLQKDQTWTSPQQWSYTETLVLSFNLGNDETDQWGSTITDGDDGTSGSGGSGSGSGSDSGSSSGGSSGGTGNNENPLKGLDGQENGQFTAGATRTGYFSFTFSASRGVSTLTAAGIAWSYSATYSDSISIGASASGSAHYTPTTATQGSGNSGSSGGQNSGSTEDGIEHVYPTDFSAESSWGASVNLAVVSSGTMTVSSTPSLNSSGQVERDNNASFTYSAGGQGDAESHWASSSKSGNLVVPRLLPHQGGNPLSGCITCVFDGSVEDGQTSADEWIDVNPDDDTDVEIDPAPIGQMTGSGHLSASSGSGTEGISGDATGNFNVQSRTRGAELLSLAGSASSDVDGASDDSGQTDHGYLYRDEFTIPIPGGTSHTIMEYTSGWRGKGDANGDADGDADAAFSLAPDGIPSATIDASGSVDGVGNSNGDDLVYLFYNVHNIIGQPGTSPNGNINSGIIDKTIVFRSQNVGKTDGTGDGDATEDTTSASIDSDVDGKGNSLLVINTISQRDIVENPGLDPELRIYAIHSNSNQIEIYKGKFSIDGDLTGNRSNGGPIGWTINAGMSDDLDVKYKSDQSFSGVEILAGGMVTGDYNFVRSAKFEAARTSSASAVGGGGISPQIGGDTGQTTASWSNGQTGDTEVIIVLTGNDAGISLAGGKTALEMDLEAMFGYGPGSSSGGESGSESGGSSSGGSSGGGSSGGGGSNPSGGGSVVWAGTVGFFKGLGQGVCNLVNGVQDAAVGVGNLAIAIPNTVAGGIDYVSGETNPNNQIRIPYIPSPDWSRNLITEESGTAGGWNDSHGWSKFFAGEGAVSLLTGGASKAASAVDDAGQCANWFAKFVNGGCFVAGTLVTLSEIPRSEASDDALWSDLAWQDTSYSDPATSLLTSATLTSLLGSARRTLVPIEQVPIGARVPTKNPRPWEYDDSLPDPVQSEWGLISITMVREDGGIVDAELIRPWAWIQSHRIQAGKPLPMNIPELQVTGVAMVTSIGECPAIAEGEGSVVTARFLTRQVEIIARAEILSPDGSIEVLEGTTIHPIWLPDRNDWVPLGEIQPNEQLAGNAGPARVLSIAIVNRPNVVYNIEVHGEHVYQVGELGAMVHNSCQVGSFNLSQTVANHIDDLTKNGRIARPYMSSPLVVKEIIASGKAVADDFVEGALRWDVPGAMNGTKGVWELVLNTKTNTIIHWLFVGK